MNEQQTPTAPVKNQRQFQQRTEEQLRAALSQFCHGKASLSVPVDFERDPDMILSDGITELMVLRARQIPPDPESSITEEDLVEIEGRVQTARVALEREAITPSVICMVTVDMPTLLDELHHLRAKLQEQENTIATLQAELNEPTPEF